MAKVKTDSKRIRKITESVIGLPTLPTVVTKMIDQVDSPRTSAASLARLISSDQALTAKVLKLANSAYYGFPREISTVNMAIVVLGFNAVKEMGLSLSVFDVFKNTPSSGGFDVTRFWEHSIGCGVASRMLARVYRAPFAGEAFVAGLLHDIGKVILKQYFDTEFAEIIRLQKERSITLEEAEVEVIETSHAQIGAWLAEKWNLPKVIADTVLYHHRPWEAPAEPVFIACATLGDYLCHLSSVGGSGRLVPPVLDSRMWELFGRSGVQIDETLIPALQTEFLLEFDKSDSFVTMATEL
ncbi:MAG: HDOD domain-containing protein [Chitinispirillaceae bacterium]|jgi:putative nucleotidyltransferase with HDIG domain|nr:HDOD domain-containing protein [Chitinispirillaceae bacterium]